MDAIEIIAVCMLLLTGMFSLVALGLFVALWRSFRTLRKVESLLEDVKRDLTPILADGRKTAEYVRELGVMARHQVGRSEPMVEETLRNVHDITHRVKESVEGATVILSALGKIAGYFSRR